VETERARIGDFQLLEKIGEGSLGTVFKAVCLVETPPLLHSGQEVALKKLHPSADLLREMQALRALSHPHIVRFLACFTARQGEWDEAAVLVTELLEGHDLALHLQAAPEGLPWDEAKRILDQTLDALAYAESQGVVHRDLKPSNLFLCRDGSVKVIDFGLARRIGGTVSLSAESRTRGGLTGTLDYMAPEYARVDGFRGDTVSDIFSFGVLACQVLSGVLPFPPLGEHPEIAFIRRWTGAQPPRASLPRPVAYAWEGAASFLARALNPDRAARFSSFRAMREALAAIRPRILVGNADTYTIRAFLASGGFCDVFRARGDRSGTEVAIKRLHAGRHEWRFRREAGLLKELQALDHPALVRILELVEEPGPDGAPCLVMEFLPGEDLRRRLNDVWETGTGMPWTETARLFIRYLEGLEALHGRGIAHRDLKPANLYAPAGRPGEGRLLDLGIACEKDGTVSMQGMPPGTLDYMAPELATGTGSRGSPQSDLFALGYSLFEALTGRPALKRLPREEASALRALCARSESETAFRAAFEGFDAPVFRERPELAVIVGAAMRFDPADRYGGREESGPGAWKGAGARAMRQALESVLTGVKAGVEPLPIPSGPAKGAPPTSDQTVTVDIPPQPGFAKKYKLGLVVAVLIAGTGLALWNTQKRKPDSPVPAETPVPVAVTVPVESPPIAPVPAPVSEPIPPIAEPPAPPVPEPVTVPAVVPEAPRVVIRPPVAVPKPDVAAAVPTLTAPPVNVPTVAPAPASEPDIQEQVEPVLALEEAAIEGWRHWLSRIGDPLRAVTLRRYEPNRQKPAWTGELPFLLAAEVATLPAELRWRYERALLWEQAVPELNDPAAYAKLAVSLRNLADRAKESDPGVAEQCRLDSLLLEWDGRKMPAAKELPSLPEARIWRAHGLAARGDDQDSREVLTELASAAGLAGAVFRAEDALLAVRAADACLGQAVRDIRDKTPFEVVTPGTGHAVRNPVAAYTQAVARVREQAMGDVKQVLAVAKATGAEEAGAMAGRLEAGLQTALTGDWVWALSELDGTPWREGRKVWAERVKRLPAGDKAILDHMLGRTLLPAKVQDIPVERLRVQ
jgi:serine/threonine protein kinase